jgi:hypothetical protein
MRLSNRARAWAIGVGVTVSLLAALASFAIWTAPERDSLRTYTELITAANLEDVATARSLCSAHYLQTHDLRAAPDGGLVGLPRGIHKNFQVWRAGAEVRLCPMNRIGPVYRFVRESAGWKFDGPIGILRGRGEFVPIAEGGGSGSEPAEDR